VDINTNKDELEKESIHLAQTGYFYKCFQTLAEDHGVDIGDGICSLIYFMHSTHISSTELKVTNFLLAFEIVGTGHNPSPASGLDLYDLQYPGTTNYTTVAWLLEPRCQKQFKKWTGTCEHPSYTNNMVGSVLTCFGHFVYLYSKKTVVLADVQSM